MAKKVQEKPAAPVDEFAGQGGSYTLDPETGKRTLVERTRPADLKDELKEVNDVSADA